MKKVLILMFCVLLVGAVFAAAAENGTVNASRQKPDIKPVEGKRLGQEIAARNAIENAEKKIAQATEVVANSNATDLREMLAKAESKLADANAAYESKDFIKARNLALTAHEIAIGIVAKAKKQAASARAMEIKKDAKAAVREIKSMVKNESRQIKAGAMNGTVAVESADNNTTNSSGKSKPDIKPVEGKNAIHERDARNAIENAEKKVGQARDAIANLSNATELKQMLAKAESRLAEAKAAYEKRDFLQAKRLALSAHELAVGVLSKAKQHSMRVKAMETRKDAKVAVRDVKAMVKNESRQVKAEAKENVRELKNQSKASVK
ncbi:hypothetical protein HYY74_04155 [Candidatus Woesearchaeota archaeon]|nr:hypothetical protein [Candidatus Woesearchaeota archaeon]